MSRLSSLRRAPVILVGILLLGSLALFQQASGKDTITVSATFTQTIGLYAGDDVRVLGVPMGTITEITQRGDGVEVRMELDPATPVAADTAAVIVPPGILDSRYVQLTEPWLVGAKLGDGDTLDATRTAAPLELDDVTAELNKFLVALGPKGANKKGGLTDLVTSSARALDGNGSTLRQTLTDLSNALGTLDDSSGDIVATISHLQTFVSALAGSDQEIRVLETTLADVSNQLADQRPALEATVRNVAATTQALQRFVRRNGGELTDDVRLLARLTTTLADRRRELEEIADLGSLGIEAIFGAANLDAGVLDARVDLTPLLANPDTTLCQILAGLAVPQLCPSTVPPTPNDEGGR